jgi:c-di-GMP-binding flagellar brake protein YcgR
MLRDILTLGDKIDIRPIDRNGKPAAGARTLVSQLVDFADFDVIHIAAPIVYSRAILLSAGENYNLCFYANKGLYQCNCVVLSNHKEKNTINCVVRITTNLEKFQRRQYFRLECIHEIEYRVMTEEEELLARQLHSEDFKDAEERTQCRKRLSQIENQWIQAAITDISGGGARFNSALEHAPGDKLRMKLDLVIGNDLKKMVLNADVISSGRIMNRSGVYEHRVAFNDIMQRDREDLIKYIFEQERKRRKSDKS